MSENSRIKNPVTFMVVMDMPKSYFKSLVATEADLNVMFESYLADALAEGINSFAQYSRDMTEQERIDMPTQALMFDAMRAVEKKNISKHPCKGWTRPASATLFNGVNGMDAAFALGDITSCYDIRGAK